MNSKRVRTSIIKKTIRETNNRRDTISPATAKSRGTAGTRPHMVWKGTFFMNKTRNFTAYRKWDLNKAKIFLFTVAYIYQDHNVHYVAFALDTNKSRLVCFDPGDDLYLYGKLKIIPRIVNDMRKCQIIKRVTDVKLVAKCEGSMFGIQYDGRSARKTVLPADAFCQSWTIYFLKMYVEHNGSTSFFKDWCKIEPSLRQLFLLESFIIPTINTDRILYRSLKDDIPLLRDRLLTNYWTRLKMSRKHS